MKGRVSAFTIIHVAGSDSVSVPYGIAVIEGTTRLLARVEQPTQLTIGADVEFEAHDLFGWIVTNT
jgi:uncharacterized OB-fold protein